MAKTSLSMKVKDWVLWLCVVALLVTELFLFSANRQKDAARVQLRETKTELDQLHSQLDQLKNSSVVTLSADNSRLRAENQGLTQKFARLQEESRKLQQQVQKLNQQLETAHSTAQQQQQQLQQMQEENQQTDQGNTTGTSADSNSPTSTQATACINNLREIELAKQQWALDNNRSAAAMPTVQDLVPYFPDGVIPVCPSGGIYTLNAVGTAPTCSIPGHVLPQ